MPFSEESLKRQRVSKACDNCRRKKKRGPPKGYIEAIENKLHRMEHLLSDLVQSDPRAAESVLAELQKLEGLDDVRLRLANRARPSEFNELRRRDVLTLQRTSPTSSEASTQVKVWDPVMEALNDEASQLTLDDQGRVRYMGFSSGFYLLQHTEKYRDGLFHMKPLMHCPLDDEEISSNPYLLPPAPVFDHLMDIYFSHINPIIPLLHKAEFMARLKQEKEEAPLFLLNAIFALAANLSPRIQWLEEAGARSEMFYKRAKKLLDQTYDVTSLENIQALILLSHYFHITHGSMKSWVYSGMAIRMAEDLGLHRNPDRWQIKTLSSSLKETRKRTWWSCYVMDRNASACMGRPLSIDDRHCDTSFPQVDVVQTTRGTGADELLNSGMCMDAFVEVIKLHEIYGQIMNNIYAIRAHPTENPFKSESFLLELDSALHKWMVELPTALQYNPQHYFDGRKPASNYVAYLHILYHSALILLHRPYIPKPNSRVCPSPYPSLQICITSANSITAIAHLCSGEPGLEEVLIFVLFPIFTAATVHLTNMTSRDMRLADLSKRYLSKNMVLLCRIRKRWGSAGKYYIVLRELLAARNISIDEHDTASYEALICSSPENKKAANPDPQPHGDSTYSTSYILSGAITNVGFDPNAPSNTLSEMTVNNQHLINQCSHSANLPLWNVPLSFDFDEWNEYVGQYSKNFNSPVPVGEGNPDPLGPATPPQPSIYNPSYGPVRNSPTQFHHRPIVQPQLPTKPNPVLEARPLHLYHTTR
ncbi:hypothetical protein K493DRAFT_243493 [Basidiobolus meristosporus CBS 931.73]|uniref:Xylanolytic transcriptional activator regulatory domain-containing protein n=1 Tax=Basidiobolus meristosporus CBS 931.73 TaxID=1314790 RepID=A0A1Y1X1D2_9FUNG|nr:hypothetical protein K493DRAFT_243493 [Basidiobolus meristosporus CBS 931.73]|eukprot:ORX79621.1 hypothetical protein K493DRAFT_243493 [Basidiobolus meristosporus CBS 931.73]